MSYSTPVAGGLRAKILRYKITATSIGGVQLAIQEKLRQRSFLCAFRKSHGGISRGAFWELERKVGKDQLLRQIEHLKAMGFGGFHMHSRTGLATEYLSDEFMEMVKACCDKAEQEHMLAWLYDEDRWSSGPAGGLGNASHCAGPA